jgi:hypothetical protein
VDGGTLLVGAVATPQPDSAGGLTVILATAAQAAPG